MPVWDRRRECARRSTAWVEALVGRSCEHRIGVWPIVAGTGRPVRPGSRGRRYVAGVPNGDNITVAELLGDAQRVCTTTPAPPSRRQSSTMTRPGFWAPQELLAISFAQPATFPPGTSHEYRNTNYVLLGLVVEKVDGRPLAKAMQKRLFRPLGLSDTVYPASTSNVIPRPFAHGYLHGSSSVVITAIPDPPYTPEYPAAIEAGTVQPTDHTSLNHSMAYVTGAAHLHRRRSRHLDPGAGRRAGCSTPSTCGSLARQLQLPRLPVRHRPAFLRGTQPAPYLHGRETVGYNSEAAYDPVNKLTFVVWTNLTISPFGAPSRGTLTANRLMVEVLDRAYRLSPLAPGALVPQPIDPGLDEQAAPTANGAPRERRGTRGPLPRWCSKLVSLADSCAAAGHVAAPR